VGWLCPSSAGAESPAGLSSSCQKAGRHEEAREGCPRRFWFHAEAFLGGDLTEEGGICSKKEGKGNEDAAVNLNRPSSTR